MKKALVVVLCVALVCGALVGCEAKTNNHIVSDGAPLQREDFNTYKEGELLQDIDKTESLITESGLDTYGYLSISDNSYDDGITTARNIKVGDTVETVEKAYAGNRHDLYDAEANASLTGVELETNKGKIEYTYVHNGYMLEFTFKDGKVAKITMNNPQSLENMNEWALKNYGFDMGY